MFTIHVQKCEQCAFFDAESYDSAKFVWDVLVFTFVFVCDSFAAIKIKFGLKQINFPFDPLNFYRHCFSERTHTQREKEKVAATNVSLGSHLHFHRAM